MDQLFNIDLKKLYISSKKEELERKKNFELFLKSGLPNKKDESWKFTDLNFIIKKNFKKISINDEFKFDKVENTLKAQGNITIKDQINNYNFSAQDILYKKNEEN